MKEETEENKTKIPWWIILIIVLLVLWSISSGNKLDEYSDCVDYCSIDLDDCIGFNDIPLIIEGKTRYFYESYEVNSCISDLEICIDECESKYRY